MTYKIKFKKIVLSIFLLVIVGCSSDKVSLGSRIPNDAEKVLLKELLIEPAKWNGKKILIHGIVSGQCGSLCDFNLKEGGSVVTVFPDGYELPKLEIGKAANVYALITAGEERVVVSAIGIELK